jgi:hypothetical protein
MKIIWAMTLSFCIFGPAGLKAVCQAASVPGYFLCDGSVSDDELQNAEKKFYEARVSSVDLGRI